MVFSTHLHQVLPEVVVGVLEEVLEEVDLRHLPLLEPASISLLLLSLRSVRLLVSRCLPLSDHVTSCPYNSLCKRRARKDIPSVTLEVSSRWNKPSISKARFCAC